MSGFDFGFNFANAKYVPPDPDINPLREPDVGPYPGFNFARSDKAFFERSRAAPPQ